MRIKIETGRPAKHGLLAADHSGCRPSSPAHRPAAQTYGFATLPPGTLNHTTASAIAKVLKEKAGINMLVQPTAGDNVIVPMVGRDEAEIGISNVMEVRRRHGGRAEGPAPRSPPRMRCARRSSCARTAR